MAEVARKLARDGIGQRVVRRKVADISTLSQVVPVSLEIAVGVYESNLALRRNAKANGLTTPGLSDAVVLSTARVLDGTVVTGDPHFRGFPESTWLGS